MQDKLHECEIADLRELQEQISAEIARREVVEGGAQRLFEDLQRAYEAIEYGSHWKSELTLYAVDRLEAVSDTAFC
jgi:hypothetical protein